MIPISLALMLSSDDTSDDTACRQRCDNCALSVVGAGVGVVVGVVGVGGGGAAAAAAAAAGSGGADAAAAAAWYASIHSW